MCLGLAMVSAMGVGGSVWFGVGDRSIVLDPAYDLWSVVEGSARFQGPMFTEDHPNWRSTQHYAGVAIPDVLRALGGMPEDGYLHVIAGDGYAKRFPRDVAMGASSLGTPVLAWTVDGEDDPEWPPLPVFVFLPEDGDVSNERMVEALGPDAHMFRDLPSASGMRVTGVSWVTTEWDGEMRSLPEHPELLPDPEDSLSITKESVHTYPLPELMARYAAISGRGRYVTSTERMVERSYEGIPLVDLLGAWPEDATVEIVAADGYRMRHRYGDLVDDEGIWILAFRSDGGFLPSNVRPLRMVKVGPGSPRFEGALSARMVVAVEVRGPYVGYNLDLSGARVRTFERGELEAGAACPCHTATVSVTRDGTTLAYTGLPLWRLLAYVDDDMYPPLERGIYYEDFHFNDALAADGYTVKIRGADGSMQRIPVEFVARDDRYIIALKEDGRFLDDEAGPLAFVWDEGAPVPEGLEWVPGVVAISILWEDGQGH